MIAVEYHKYTDSLMQVQAGNTKNDDGKGKERYTKSVSVTYTIQNQVVDG